MTNFPALDEAISYAVEHPEEFNMSSWYSRPADTTCGTTACLAGTAAILAGYQPILRVLRGDRVLGDAVQDQAGREQDVFSVGRAVLGLTEGQAHHLFYCGSIVSVIRGRNEYAEDEGQPVRSWKVPLPLVPSGVLGWRGVRVIDRDYAEVQ